MTSNAYATYGYDAAAAHGLAVADHVSISAPQQEVLSTGFDGILGGASPLAASLDPLRLPYVDTGVAVRQALTSVTPVEAMRSAAQLLLVYCSNLVQHPEVEKFHRVKVANKAFARRVATPLGGARTSTVMTALGFSLVELPEGGQAWRCMHPSAAEAAVPLLAQFGGVPNPLSQVGGGAGCSLGPYALPSLPHLVAALEKFEFPEVTHALASLQEQPGVAQGDLLGAFLQARSSHDFHLQGRRLALRRVGTYLSVFNSRATAAGILTGEGGLGATWHHNQRLVAGSSLVCEAGLPHTLRRLCLLKGTQRVSESIPEEEVKQLREVLQAVGPVAAVYSLVQGGPSSLGGDRMEGQVGGGVVADPTALLLLAAFSEGELACVENTCSDLEESLGLAACSAETAHAQAVSVLLAGLHDEEFELPTVSTEVILETLLEGNMVIEPIDAGGVAGGDKFLVKEERLFVKVSCDSNQVYGSELMAGKAAGREVGVYQWLLQCDLPLVVSCLYQCLDVCGRRVQVFTQLPLGENSLQYGSQDGRRTMHSSPTLEPCMSQVAEAFYLGRHVVTTADGVQHSIATPFDVEGHVGSDGRAYVLDVHRLLPPEPAWAEEYRASLALWTDTCHRLAAPGVEAVLDFGQMVGATSIAPESIERVHYLVHHVAEDAVLDTGSRWHALVSSFVRVAAGDATGSSLSLWRAVCGLPPADLRVTHIDRGTGQLWVHLPTLALSGVLSLPALYWGKGAHLTRLFRPEATHLWRLTPGSAPLHCDTNFRGCSSPEHAKHQLENLLRLQAALTSDANVVAVLDALQAALAAEAESQVPGQSKAPQTDQMKQAPARAVGAGSAAAAAQAVAGAGHVEETAVETETELAHILKPAFESFVGQSHGAWLQHRKVLKAVMHAHGLSLRHAGLLLHHCLNDASRACLLPVIACGLSPSPSSTSSQALLLACNSWHARHVPCEEGMEEQRAWAWLMHRAAVVAGRAFAAKLGKLNMHAVLAGMYPDTALVRNACPSCSHWQLAFGTEPEGGSPIPGWACAALQLPWQVQEQALHRKGLNVELLLKNIGRQSMLYKAPSLSKAGDTHSEEWQMGQAAVGMWVHSWFVMLSSAHRGEGGRRSWPQGLSVLLNLSKALQRFHQESTVLAEAWAPVMGWIQTQHDEWGSAVASLADGGLAEGVAALQARLSGGGPTSSGLPLRLATGQLHVITEALRLPRAVLRLHRPAELVAWAVALLATMDGESSFLLSWTGALIWLLFNSQSSAAEGEVLDTLAKLTESLQSSNMEPSLLLKCTASAVTALRSRGLGRSALAQKLLQASEDMQQRLASGGSGDLAAESATHLKTEQAQALFEQGDNVKALELFQDVFESVVANMGRHHPASYFAQCNVAMVLSALGQHDRAVPLMQESVASIALDRGNELSPRFGVGLFTAGKVYMAAGKLDMAAEAFRRVRELQAAHYPTDSIGVSALAELAQSQRRQGQVQESIDSYKQCLEELDRLRPEPSPQRATVMFNLGRSLKDVRQFDEALKYYHAALAMRKEVLGEGHAETILANNNIGQVYHAQGQYREAVNTFRAAWRAWIRHKGRSGYNFSLVSMLSNLTCSMLAGCPEGDAQRAWLQECAGWLAEAVLVAAHCDGFMAGLGPQLLEAFNSVCPTLTRARADAFVQEGGEAAALPEAAPGGPTGVRVAAGDLGVAVMGIVADDARVRHGETSIEVAQAMHQQAVFYHLQGDRDMALVFSEQAAGIAATQQTSNPAMAQRILTSYRGLASSAGMQPSW